MNTMNAIIFSLVALSIISQANSMDIRSKIASKFGRKGLGTPLTNQYINYGPAGGRGGSSASAAAAANGGYGGSSSAAAAASSAPSYGAPAYPVEPVGVPYNTGRIVDNNYVNGGNSALKRATHSSSSVENGNADDNHYLHSSASDFSNDEDLNQHYQKKKENVNSTPYAYNSKKKEESFTMNYKNRHSGSENAHTEHDRHHSNYNKNRSNFDEDVEHSVNNGFAGPSTYYSTSAHEGEEGDNYYDSDGLNGYARPAYYNTGYQRPAPVYPARVVAAPQYRAPRANYATSAASAAATSNQGGSSAAASAATGGAYARPIARPRLYKQSYGGVPAVNLVSQVVPTQSSSASALNKSDFYEQDQSNDHTISSSTSTDANAPSVALSGAGGNILMENPVSNKNYYENNKSKNFVKSTNQYNEVAAEASPTGAAAISSNNYYEHDKSDDHTIQTDDATENTTIDGQSKSGNSYYENNSNKDYVKSTAVSDESIAYPGSTAKSSSNFYEANKSKNFVKSSSNYSEDKVATPLPTFAPQVPSFVAPSYIPPTPTHVNPYIVRGTVPSAASAAASASSSSAI